MPAPGHGREDADRAGFAAAGLCTPTLQEHFVNSCHGKEVSFQREGRVGETAEAGSGLIPIRVEAMVATKGKLFVAGAPDVLDEDNDPFGALEGRKGGLLRAVSSADGAKLSEYPLAAPPVLDGLIAVENKLFLATRDGKLSCWE